MRVAERMKKTGIEEVVILEPIPRTDVSEVERKIAEGVLFSEGWQQEVMVRKLNM